MLSGFIRFTDITVSELREKVKLFTQLCERKPNIEVLGTFKDIDTGEIVFTSYMSHPVNKVLVKYFVINIDGEDCKVLPVDGTIDLVKLS